MRNESRNRRLNFPRSELHYRLRITEFISTVFLFYFSLTQLSVSITIYVLFEDLPNI